jgi:DNA replication licensing factor MCM4
MHLIEEPFFNFDCAHLKHFNVELYKQLVCYPIEVMEAFDTAVKEFYFTKFPNDDLNLRVRPFNVDKITSMRELNPTDIDQLVTMTGMIIRLSNIIPEMAEAFFKCSVCSASCTVKLERGRILEPTICQTCNTNHSYELIHNRCIFYDKQLIKLQESPDEMPAGETPCTIALYVRDDLVDSIQPGDRVEVTGMYRAIPLRVNPKTRNVKSVYKTHVEVLHFKKKDLKRLYEINDDTDINSTFTPERIMKLRSMSTESDIYARLAAAIAPDIFENDDVKKGILLQLFGGTSQVSAPLMISQDPGDPNSKQIAGPAQVHSRSEINILLCGDPGTSKSQLLQYIYRLVPRAQYTSGKGSSAVGLTAFVSKDVETGQYVLQTGALVLADNGVCCIDEFDKMSDYTRAVLHEVMEQQTLSIAKCGLICKLNARTSILAAANPIDSKWAKNKTIVDNIQLPHTLMSRFDLIFLILDPDDEHYDRRLALHLVSLYHTCDERLTDHGQKGLEMDLLKDYIMYAKTQYKPKLTEESGRALVEAYLEMRKMGSGKGQITAYPRQLQSLIRLAEAHAKMRFSKFVDVSDVDEGKRLHREALKQSAIDPKTGRIDIGILTTGFSSEERRNRDEIADTLKKLIRAKGKISTMKKESLFQDLLTQSDVHIQRDLFESALRDLQEDDYLIITDQVIRILSN